MTVLAEPARRLDGRCACGCRKRLRGVPAKRQKGVSDEVYLSEPFASTECCKAYFGVVLSGVSSTDGDPRLAR